MNKKIILSMVGMMLFGMIIGTGIMMNDEAYKAVKGAINGGGTDNMIGYMGVNGINPLQIQSMDIETALLMVQSNRANLLETQLRDQINEVTKRNELLAELNKLINSLVSEKHQSKVSYTLDQTTTDSLKEYGILSESKQSYSLHEIDTMITTLKARVDNASNSQQMDMLRLQSLSNKRNEAFDIMTNFVKKMQDSRSSIIGNMR